MCNKEHSTSPSKLARRLTRVLIVEDDPLVSDGLSAFFDACGIEVVAVNRGALGLSTLETSIPDLVLVDIGLPDIDGRLLSQRMRNRRSDLRIALISGHVSSVPGLPDGMIFLQKPFTLDELDHALARVGLTLGQPDS